MSLQTTDREPRFCFSTAAGVTQDFSSRGHLKGHSAACHRQAAREEHTREGQRWCPHLYREALAYRASTEPASSAV